MQLTLMPQEARLLERHLAERLRQLDVELARTDKHELQHELAREVDQLRALTDRLREISAEDARRPEARAGAAGPASR
jgi:hypothetical protein